MILILTLWLFGALLFSLKQNVEVLGIRALSSFCFSSLWSSSGSWQMFHITAYESTLKSCAACAFSPSGLKLCIVGV